MRASLFIAVVPLLLVAACSEAREPAGVTPPPVAVITSPAAGSKYAAGDVIQLAIGGTLDGAPLPESALSHWVVFHHGQHTHPFRPRTEGSGEAVEIPRVGHADTDVFYRFYARAEAPDGRADTVFVDPASTVRIERKYT